MEVCEKRGCITTRFISDASEFREPEFYKLATTVTYDDYSQNTYTVPVGI